MARLFGPAGRGTAMVATEEEHATGEGEASGASGARAASRVNVVQELLASEIRVWQRVLPLVHKLLHPQMRSASWQKIFATLPPPTAVKEASSKDLLDVDEEAERRKAAEEMAKLRAPGAMCLRFLWEVGLDSFEPVIERVLASTLARTSPCSSPASKQASRPGSGM